MAHVTQNVRQIGIDGGRYANAVTISPETHNGGESFSNFRAILSSQGHGRVVTAWSDDFDGKLDVYTNGDAVRVGNVRRYAKETEPGDSFTLSFEIVGARTDAYLDFKFAAVGRESSHAVLDDRLPRRDKVEFARDEETGAQLIGSDGAPLVRVWNSDDSTRSFTFDGHAKGSFDAPPGVSLVSVPGLPEKGMNVFRNDEGRFLGRDRLDLKRIAEHPEFAEVSRPPSGPPHTDFDGDGQGDVLWARQTGDAGHFIAPATDPNAKTFAGYHDKEAFLALGDFDGDGTEDAAWMFEATGGIAVDSKGSVDGREFQGYAPGSADAARDTLLAVADLNGDGRDDMLWRYSSGGVFAARSGDMNERSWIGMKKGQTLEAAADFDGDGADELLWSRENALGANYVQGGNNAAPPTFGGFHRDETLLAAGDFDGDGADEALWKYDRSDGVYHADPHEPSDKTFLGYFAGQEILGVGDFDGDGADDALWRYQSGGTYSASGGDASEKTWQGPRAGETLIAVGDFTGGSQADTMWQRDTGGTYVADGMDHTAKEWAGDHSDNLALGQGQKILGLNLPSGPFAADGPDF